MQDILQNIIVRWCQYSILSHIVMYEKERGNVSSYNQRITVESQVGPVAQSV